MIPPSVFHNEMTRVYIKLRGLILDACVRFKDRYGGEVEELLSEAHLHFVRAFVTYNQERGSVGGTDGMKARIMYRVWNDLLETHRNEEHRRKLLPKEEVLDLDRDERFGREQEPFDLDDFTGTLGTEDAAVVVRLVFQSPRELMQLVLKRGVPSPLNFRVSLKSYLRGVGWSLARVVEGFNEVRRALG